MARYEQKRLIQSLLSSLGYTLDLRGTGAPTDGVTGKNTAQKGSTYIDTATGEHYYNKGTQVSPTWKKVTTA